MYTPLFGIRTGASSGLGLALLLRILARTSHDRIIAAVRDPSKLESALNFRLAHDTSNTSIIVSVKHASCSTSGSTSQPSKTGEERAGATFASLVAAGRLKAFKMDLTESWEDVREKIQEEIEKWAGGKVDVLVNNAGVGIAGLSEEGGYVQHFPHGRVRRPHRFAPFAGSWTAL